MAETDFLEGTLHVGPTVHPTAFIARGAQVMGDVRIMAETSVWYTVSSFTPARSRADA